MCLSPHCSYFIYVIFIYYRSSWVQCQHPPLSLAHSSLQQRLREVTGRKGAGRGRQGWQADFLAPSDYSRSQHLHLFLGPSEIHVLHANTHPQQEGVRWRAEPLGGHDVRAIESSAMGQRASRGNTRTPAALLSTLPHLRTERTEREHNPLQARRRVSAGSKSAALPPVLDFQPLEP